MSVKISDKITVPIERVDKMYQILKDSGVEEASFEYIIGSCFPQAFENIKTKIRESYTQGYLDGLNDGEKTQK